MKKLLLIVTVVILALSFVACGSDETAKELVVDEPVAEKSEPTETVIVDDDTIKATYIKIFEEEATPGNLFLQIKIENKSDSQISVGLAESSINDTSAIFGSGVPLTIKPSDNGIGVFVTNAELIGITELPEVKNIEFIVVDINSDYKSEVVRIDI